MATNVNLGTRLGTARQRLGLNLETVEQRTGIGKSTLSEWEHGKREPSISQLAILAREYSRSLSYFFDEETTTEPVILWRQRPEETVAREQEARFRLLCEQYRHLESWCGDIITSSLPRCEVDPMTFTWREAEALARNVRHELNLGDYPAYGLLSALESTCGIKVFHENFVPTGPAACVRSDAYGMAILLNAGNVWYRRNFDLAHELFHLLTWNCFRILDPDGSVKTANETEEKLADRFANSLLIPAEALQQVVGRKLDEKGSLSLAVLPSIALQFGVSIDVLLWRIHNVYHFGKARTEETKRRIEAAKKTQEARRIGGMGDVPPQYPERYMALAIQAFVTGEISTGKFCEYTGRTRRAAMKLMESEEAALGEVQVTAG